jgi:hypothetical protein
MTTSTSTLTLKTALGSYGHVAALKDGSVKPDGVTFDYVDVAPIVNAFRRMCRQLEFDVSEMAITTYITAKAYGLPFTALPVFPVRAFHHGAWVYNTKAGVKEPGPRNEGRHARLHGHHRRLGRNPRLRVRRRHEQGHLRAGRRKARRCLP